MTWLRWGGTRLGNAIRFHPERLDDRSLAVAGAEAILSGVQLEALVLIGDPIQIPISARAYSLEMVLALQGYQALQI
jgi:hypothetical protein